MRRIALALLVVFGLFMTRPANASKWCEDVQVGIRYVGNVVVPVFDQQCRWVAGAVGFDPATRALTSAWNRSDAGEAYGLVQSGCPSCVVASFYEDALFIAMSDEDVWGISKDGPKRAVLECAANGGRNCEVVIAASSTAQAVYWTFNALAFDADTRAKASVSQFVRRREALDAARQSCGQPGCWTFVFQQPYGAIAKADDGQLFGAASDSRRSASKNVMSACKKAGGKGCAVVHEGSVVTGIASQLDVIQQQIERMSQQTGAR